MFNLLFSRSKLRVWASKVQFRTCGYICRLVELLYNVQWPFRARHANASFRPTDCTSQRLTFRNLSSELRKGVYIKNIYTPLYLYRHFYKLASNFISRIILDMNVHKPGKAGSRKIDWMIFNLNLKFDSVHSILKILMLFFARNCMISDFNKPVHILNIFDI